MKIVVISGTPGTGKTTLAKEVIKFINAKKLSLNELTIEKGFTIGYDVEKNTAIIDQEKLVDYVSVLIEKLNKNDIDYLIIEGHFSDIIPSHFIDLVIVLRCDPYVLVKRLEDRNYKREKVIENVQSEILGNCVNYFINKNLHCPVLEIDTTDIGEEQALKLIIEIITKNKNHQNYRVGKIDWIQKLSDENRIFEFFESN